MQGPPRQRNGEWRSLNPPAAAEWGMPEAKSPSGEEGGEWRSLNPPPAAARWESPERGNAQPAGRANHPPQASSAPKHLHSTLPATSLAPPVEKPYEWRTTSTSKALQRIFSAPLSCKYYCTGNVTSIIAPFCNNCLPHFITISPHWK